MTAYEPQLWNKIAPETISRTDIAGVIVYSEITHLENVTPSEPIPSIHHLAGKASSKLQRSEAYTAYDYPSATTHLFASPHQPAFHYSSESVSHTRNLTFLKKRMNGPYFDLEAIWDEHTYYEFENRSVENTMATMVQEPYVNHIPTVRILTSRT
jgi:carboxymethylenebutenolidase